ncbi:MAG: ROK family protein [Bacillota bacterium]
MPDYVVGVDLGGTKLVAGQVAPDGKVTREHYAPTDVAAGPGGVLAQVAAAIRRVSEPQPPAAIGLGVPGLVDVNTGACLFSPNLFWRDVPVAQIVSESLSLPVFIDNDVNVATLGEHRLGAGRGYRNLIMVTIGTGIGAGLVVEGRLYRGPGGSAGELGHVPVDPAGQVCNCGNRGCLETTCSGPAMARRAAQLVTPSSMLWRRHQPLDARAVFEAARCGDQLALELVRETAAWLGMGLAGVVNLLNPELIIVGGGVAAAGGLLLEPLRENIKRRALPHPAAMVEVAVAALGARAGVAGAGLLAWDGVQGAP